MAALIQILRYVCTQRLGATRQNAGGAKTAIALLLVIVQWIRA